MFYLQEGLGPTGGILEFFGTPHCRREDSSVGGIVSWDRDDKGGNRILVPSSGECRVEGVKVTGCESRIHTLELHEPLSDSPHIRGSVIRAPMTAYRLELGGLNEPYTVLATLNCSRGDNQAFPAIVELEGNRVLLAFDPGETIGSILRYGYLETPAKGGSINLINKVGASIATRMPIRPRNFLIKTYLNISKNVRKDNGFPAWPLDDCVDAMRWVFLSLMAIASGSGSVYYLPLWPEGKRSCFCSTHDVDTLGGFMNIPFVRDVEKKHTIPSAWFVTNEFGPDTRFLKELQDDGCEIGSHGWVHDDLWRTLSPGELSDRFRKSREQYKDLDVSGFRAPYNEFHPGMFPQLREHFSYDTSAQEARVYASVRSHRVGCCTLYPYAIEGIVELPITTPPDYLLINTLGKTPEEVYDIWTDTSARVLERGGLLLMQTHPEDFDIGNDRFIVPYDRFLEDVGKRGDCWIARPIDIVRWWTTRRRAEIRVFDEGVRVVGRECGIRIIHKLTYSRDGFETQTLDAEPQRDYAEDRILDDTQIDLGITSPVDHDDGYLGDP